MTIIYPQWRDTLKPQGDPVADTAVTELLDSGTVGDVSKLFRAFATADEQVPADAPAGAPSPGRGPSLRPLDGVTAGGRHRRSLAGDLAYLPS